MPGTSLSALSVFYRLRHAEADAARRDLGEALAQEAVLRAQDETLRRELDDARQCAGNFDRESFAAFLGRVRAKRAQLANAICEAAARTASARTALAHRRAAETVAQAAQADALAAQNAAVAQREQMALEDIARALKCAAE